MIRYAQGNLLDAEADALVNTVNTVGLMGKGIALMFKLRFEENYRRNERALGDLDADVSVFEPMTANSSILRQRVHHKAESDRGGS